jgi:hypothetical protein
METKNICVKCNKAFKTKQNLQKHLSSSSACIIVTKFQCNTCKEYLKTKKSLDDHKKSCKKIIDSSDDISNLSDDLSDSDLSNSSEELEKKPVEKIVEKTVEKAVEKAVEKSIKIPTIDIEVKEVKDIEKEQSTQTLNIIDNLKIEEIEKSIIEKNFKMFEDKTIEFDNYIDEKMKIIEEKREKLEEARIKLESTKEGLKETIVNLINKKMDSYNETVNSTMEEKIKERYDHGIEKNAAKKIIKYVEKRISEPIEEAVSIRINELTEVSKNELDSHLKKKLKETISMINKAIEIKIEEEKEKANSELLKVLGMNFSASLTANILINKYGIKNPINDLIEILQNVSISNIDKISLFYDNTNSIDIKFYKKVISCFEIVNNKKEYKNNNYLELFNRSLIDNIYYGISGIKNYVEVGKLDKRIVNKQIFSSEEEILTDDKHHSDAYRFSSKNSSENSYKIKEGYGDGVVQKGKGEENESTRRGFSKKNEMINHFIPKELGDGKEIFINLEIPLLETSSSPQKEEPLTEFQKKYIDIIEIGDKTLYYYNDMDVWNAETKTTEKLVFEYFLKEENIPDNYFAFPWTKLMEDTRTTVGDQLHHILKDIKETNETNETNDVKRMIDKKSCFTVMQNTEANKIACLQLAKDLNISHIFVSHLTESIRMSGEELGLTLIPFSLCINEDNLLSGDLIDVLNRQYLANYVGNKNKLIREKIFNEFNDKSDVYVRNDDSKDFNFEIMNNSKFTLCPSGNGVNSIRIWEAMKHGSIPVILSNSLLLPKVDEFNWTDCFVIGNEKDVSGLYEELKGMDNDKISELSNNCIKYYNKYFSNESVQNVIFSYYGV